MNIPFSSHSAARARGFTIVELLVSTALIAMIMLLLLSTVDSTNRVWQRTTTRATQFQSARNAFEAMTRRLSQATLNTYWRIYDAQASNFTAEYSFRRHSELQFLSGPAAKVFTSPSITNLNPDPESAYPTHAVFFQAPIGYTEREDTGAEANLREYRSLDSMLMSCGYFVEFGDDPDRPDFLRELGFPPRYRSRLVELSVPAERLTIFQRPKGDAPSNIDPIIIDIEEKPYVGMVGATRRADSGWIRPAWMKEALARRAGARGVSRFTYGRTMAENIVALIILPKLAIKDRANPQRLDLAPDFEYDSWRILRADQKLGAANATRDNLLPPIVQVTLVAIDEPSAVRLDADPENPPKWTEGLFKTVRDEPHLLEQMAELETRIKADPRQISYRVFSTDVVIRGSKWSKEE